MSKRWRYLLPGIFLAALLTVFVWMQLPQSFYKVIGFAENSILYVEFDADRGEESRPAPPEPTELEPLPPVLANSSLRPWGFRRSIDAQPGESLYFFTIHAFSPEGEWQGEITVALRGGDMLYKPRGENGYLWYGMDCDAKTVNQELRRVLGIN